MYNSNYSPDHDQTEVDVREEYANAFRTESYMDFWTQVHAYSYTEPTTTPSSRLPSYRLFVEHFLDPDQPTITRILSMTHHPPTIHSLLSHYFTLSANTSLLCSLLLKDIDCVRLKYRSLTNVLLSLDSLPTNHQLSNFSLLITHLIDFSSTGLSSGRILETQSQCRDLLERLESSRDKVQAKLQLIAKLKCGSAFFLVTITTSLAVVILTHGLGLFLVAGFIGASMEIASEKKLSRVVARLDAAAKGTYILNKDMETISRLVARLNDEMEHMRESIKFWVERKEDQLQFQANSEVARLMKKSQCSFGDQLDELEEHLYLCFMNINRARDLVLKQIMNQGLG